MQDAFAVSICFGWNSYKWCLARAGKTHLTRFSSWSVCFYHSQSITPSVRSLYFIAAFQLQLLVTSYALALSVPCGTHQHLQSANAHLARFVAWYECF